MPGTTDALFCGRPFFPLFPDLGSNSCCVVRVTRLVHPASLGVWHLRIQSGGHVSVRAIRFGTRRGKISTIAGWMRAADPAGLPATKPVLGPKTRAQTPPFPPHVFRPLMPGWVPPCGCLFPSTSAWLSMAHVKKGSLSDSPECNGF